jgi:hypothetical protein
MKGTVMRAETLLQELNENGGYELRRDGYWAVWPDLDVHAMAASMLAHEVRLVTITATPDVCGGLRLIYHWDLGAALLNMETTVTSGHIPTISDLLPAADWAEREIRDYYGTSFDGRLTTPPLMLREGDIPGLFSRTSGLGTETDPAETARANVASQDGEPT